MTKIAVVVYSSYNHILSLSKSEIEGARSAGVQVDAFQIPSSEPLDASAKSNLPEMTPELLTQYDGVLFGVPTRFGSMPYAVKAFLDRTASQWTTGGFYGKYVGVFVSTGTPNGGQETTVRNLLSIFTHHGMLYVPLGYRDAFPEITDLNEFHGGSPWGAGTYAGADGSRQVTDLEHKIARIQGEQFAKTVLKATSSTAGAPGTAAPAPKATTSSTAPAAKASTQAANTTATRATADAAAAKPAAAPAAAVKEEEKKEGRCFGCCVIS